MGDSRGDIRGTMPPAATAAMRTTFSKLFDEIGTVDQVGIEERVAGMGGTFDLRSAPGLGTKLLISIPLHAPDKSKRETDAPAGASPKTHENIAR